MSRPYCLICKVSTNDADRIYNIEVNLTKCTKTLLREFLNNLLAYAIKYTTLNVCSSCFDMVNELDILQNRTETARKKLLNYFSTDMEVQKDKFKSEETKIQPLKVEDNEDIEDLLNFEDDEQGTSEHEQKLENEKIDEQLDNDGLGDIASDEDDTILDPDVEFEQKGHKKKLTEKKKRRMENECPECKETFKNKAELKAHSISVHGNTRPYICEICGQRYRNKSAFDIHVGMHNGIHPFTCPHCNKTFTQKGSLQRHLNMHTGETPFQCDQCGKRFIHHSSFKVHQMHHSGQKDHKCNICNLALMTGSHLRRHMRVHTGEKRYTCELCGKRFAERYNYAVHQKVHEKHGAQFKKPEDQTEEETLKREEAAQEQAQTQPQQQYYEQNEFSIAPIYTTQPQEDIGLTTSTPLQKMSTCFNPIPSVPRIVTPVVPIWNFST